MKEAERFEQWVASGGVSEDEDIESVWIAWAAWQAAKRWIPVEERLPDIGVEVLCLNIYGDRFVGFIDLKSSWHHAFGTSENVTYWQPPPLLPEEE